MLVPFIERQPTQSEVERLRLILSTYQDGSGMENKGSLPGWRDFERTVEAALEGKASENKHIYDVLLPVPNSSAFYYGIDCKMRGLLRDVDTKGVVTIEVTNASGELWDSIKKLGFTQETYEDFPVESARAILGTVESWHQTVSTQNGGTIITEKSIYLVLQWNPRVLEYQLFQYPAQLPEAESLEWAVNGRRLEGRRRGRKVIEWYGLSGGQLKYYPHIEEATWHSDRFRLEPLPNNLEAGLRNKAASYFPKAWEATFE